MLSVAPRVPIPESPEQLVKLAPELEALPVVAQRVLALLRYANSARAMPNRRIASLREAILRIGQRHLGEVLLRACAGPMLDRGLPPYALARRVAWRHAATASAAARRLARQLKVSSP